MSKEVKHYETQYSNFNAQLYKAIRTEVYKNDIGQNSWITADEQDMFIEWLNLNGSKRLLDVACGSGETTLRIHQLTKCSIVGVDIQEDGIKTALAAAKEKGFENSVDFQLLDGSETLPFKSRSFDAIICIDAINHLPNRENVFKEWYRLLKDGGVILFTDPIVVTGILTKAQIETRASIGYFLFVAEGANDILLEKTGFALSKKLDRTDNMASVARQWEKARSKRKKELLSIEGAETYNGQQEFFDTCATLAEQKHLSRFVYLAHKGKTVANTTKKSKDGALVAGSWKTESDLNRFLKNKEVKTIIRNVIKTSKQSISADEFLKRADVLVTPITGLSLKKTADIVLPIYKRLGIRTGKSQIGFYQSTIQEIVLKVLCSLAKNDYPLTKVEQANDGVIILAEIPSDMKTFGGEIIIAIQEQDNTIQVNIDAKIKGQLYDWGKSKSAVKKIQKDIAEFDIA